MTALGVRTEISTAHSSLIFSRVLPSKVLLSPLAKLAKYLMLDFLEEERESANFTNLLERNVFKSEQTSGKGPIPFDQNWHFNCV